MKKEMSRFTMKKSKFEVFQKLFVILREIQILSSTMLTIIERQSYIMTNEVILT